MGTKRDRADALESVGPFSRWTARERRTIARHAQTASFPADTKTEVKVAVLGIRMFRTLVREVPDLAEQLLVGLAGELREAKSRVPAPTTG